MKKILLTFTLLFASYIANADDKAACNEAIVDYQIITKESSAFKDLQNQIEKKTADFQADTSKQEKDLIKQNQELTKQRTVLSEEALAKKVKEYENKVGEFYRNTQNKEMNHSRAFMEAENEINHKVLDIVAKIAKDKKINKVSPKSNFAYIDGVLDITPEVLEKLNKQLPKVNIKY